MSMFSKIIYIFIYALKMGITWDWDLSLVQQTRTYRYRVYYRLPIWRARTYYWFDRSGPTSNV